MPLAEVTDRLGRSTGTGPSGAVGAQVASFAVVGVLSTVAYAVLYLLLRGPLGPFWANAVSLVMSAVANTAANRRVTFGVRGRADALRHQVRGLAVFAVRLGVTSGALWLLHSGASGPGRWTEMVVLTVANLLVTVMRFVAMRLWVFTRR
jgi:putative flippase GtrA